MNDAVDIILVHIRAEHFDDGDGIMDYDWDSMYGYDGDIISPFTHWCSFMLLGI